MLYDDWRAAVALFLMTASFAYALVVIARSP